MPRKPFKYDSPRSAGRSHGPNARLTKSPFSFVSRQERWREVVDELEVALELGRDAGGEGPGRCAIRGDLVLVLVGHQAVELLGHGLGGGGAEWRFGRTHAFDEAAVVSRVGGVLIGREQLDPSGDELIKRGAG